MTTARLRTAPLAFLIPAALVAFAQAPPQEDANLGESPERYAQVKVLEGDAIIHKGDGEETLALGTPIAEGDVVESRARGVLQLGDGTRIAFGPRTRFRIAALFADQAGTREVLLRLDYGRIRVRLGAQSEARVRIDTPSGTETLANRADATLEVGTDGTVRHRVHAGRSSFANEQGRVTVQAGERLTVYSGHDKLDRLNDFNTYDEDDFDHWAEPMLMVRRGESASRVPPEIRYYADDLDGHGRWTYVEEDSAWCWSPSGVAADWRPYTSGRWGAYAGGMTWIADEPWGYVTHHHGRWGWGASLGWYWIPGVYYSPAWVAWQSSDLYFGWAPLGYYNRPVSWGYGAWGGGGCWNVVNVNFVNQRNLRGRFHEDPRIIRTFNQGTGATTWTPGGPARSGGAGPWFRGRLMVTPSEFRDPAQIQRVATQRDLSRDRVTSYERAAQAATGRTILRREIAPERPATPGAAAPAPRGFEGGRPTVSQRPILRETPQGRSGSPAPSRSDGGSRPEGGRPTQTDRPMGREVPQERPNPAPRSEPARPGFERPRQEDRRPEPSQDRPRLEERRPDPPQRREAPPQERRPDPPQPRQEAPRQDYRPAPRQEPRPEPRQESRPAPRQESRPEPRQESRPAPSSRGEARPSRDNTPR